MKFYKHLVVGVSFMLFCSVCANYESKFQNNDGFKGGRNDDGDDEDDDFMCDCLQLIESEDHPNIPEPLYCHGSSNHKSVKALFFLDFWDNLKREKCFNSLESNVFVDSRGIYGLRKMCATFKVNILVGKVTWCGVKYETNCKNFH